MKHLHYISNFSVIRASTLEAESGVLGQVDPLSKIPDHSLLRWYFGLDFSFTARAKSSYTTVKTKYDVTCRNISNDFLADENSKDALAQTIFKLESFLFQNEKNLIMLLGEISYILRK